MRILIYIIVSISITLSLLWFSAPHIGHYFFHVVPFNGSTFNKKKWVAAEEGRTDQEQADLDSQCIRGAMVSDLKKKYLTSKTTKIDVINLLGPTRNTGTQDNQTCLQYNLGMCSGFKVDYDSLVICFKNNLFVEAHTVQH